MKNSIITTLLLVNFMKTANCGDSMNIWAETGRMVGLTIKECFSRSSNKNEVMFLEDLQECLKVKSLMLLDKLLKKDVIELQDGVKLVRQQDFNRTEEYERRELESAEEDADWKSQVVGRIKRALETHVLKVRLNNFRWSADEGRRRRRESGMMPLLIFGTVSMGMILIPMGFQFLAVLGGKALLLAKMALLLSSIQGLKRIATSNVNYGLYRTDPCKDFNEDNFYSCNTEDNDVFASIEIDGFGQNLNDTSYFDSGNDFVEGEEGKDVRFSGRYERRWPYNMDGHSYGGPEEHHDFLSSGKDLLHPMDPRYTPIRDKFSAKK